MRPLRVKVRGFTAFADEVDLDFAGLDLFAVTGPTGAGKTSLIQAIPIALYGRAPKVADDLRQLISPSAEQARFHYEFLARGGRYRISRVIHRTRPTAVALEEHVGGDAWRSLARGVRQTAEKIEELLGLDYDTFTRVVLLPQNEFDAFLRGKPDERRAILTRLLALEIYGKIQQRANQLAAAARTEADVLTSILDRDYADATPERLAEVRAALAHAAREVDVRAESVAALERTRALAVDVRQARRDWMQASEALAELQGDLAEAREEHFEAEDAVRDALEGLRAIEDAFARITYDPDRHLVLMRAQEQASRLAEIHRRLGELAATHEQAKGVIARLARRRDEVCRTVQEAEQSLAKSQALESNARRNREALEHRVGTRATIAALIQREHQYRDDFRNAGEVETAIAALGARQEELADRLNERQAALSKSRQDLEKAQQRKAAAARTVETLRTTEGQVQALAGNLANARSRLEGARRDLERAEHSAVEKRRILLEAERRRLSAQTGLASVEEKLARLRRAHAAHELQKTLAAGEPCPVCEQTVHKVPALERVSDLDDAEQRVNRAQAEVDAADRTLRHAAGELAAADQAVAGFKTGVEEADADVERLGKEIGDLLPVDLRDDADWRARLRARVQRAARELEDAERSVTSAQGIATAASNDVAAIEAELRTIPRQLEERLQALRSLHERCRAAEAALATALGDVPGSDAGARLAAIDAELQAAELEVEHARAALQTAQQALHETRLLRTEAEQHLAAETERAQARQEERERLLAEKLPLDTALTRVVPPTDDVAGAIERELAGLVEAKAAREALLREQEDRHRASNEARQRLARLEAKIATLEGHVLERQTRETLAKDALGAHLARFEAAVSEARVEPDDGSGDERDRVETLLEAAKRAHQEALHQHAGLAGDEQHLQERVAKAVESRNQLATARTRGEVAHELGLLLGANNFQTYLLEGAMKVLTEDGSVHLERVSDGRYRLHYDDLDFQVVDRWNADAVRSVKTLSGGETFLTSLALALALAERLADLGAGAYGHEALESLFIDEGFGALDTEETLDQVIQALEALQTEHRVLGVITHLTQLADRMPAHIRVKKAPEGSWIEVER
ncbi:MAG: AAA family ATPase [Candidatus Rokuibacteriota bacterium]